MLTIQAHHLCSGRFGFVECRSEELATAGMQLDKVDLCGRHVNVGRPKGYVEPPGGAAAVPKLDLTQMFSGAAAVGLMPGGGLPGSGPMPNMPGGQIAPLPGNTYMSPLPGPPQPMAPAGPSRLLMLNNLLTAATIWDDQDRQEVGLCSAIATCCCLSCAGRVLCSFVQYVWSTY